MAGDCMARRRKIDSENTGERITTSLRLPIELLDRIDSVWKGSDKYTGRTHFIESACNYYLDCKPCPNCGHLNSGTSVVCSHCEEKLTPFQDSINLIDNILKTYDQSFKDISESIAAYDNLFEKIGWLIDKLQSESQASAKSIISGTLKSMECDITIGREILMYRELYSEYNHLPIPTPFAMLKLHRDKIVIGDRFKSITPSNISERGAMNNSLASGVSTNYNYRVGQLIVQNPLSVQYNDIMEALDNLNHSVYHIMSVAHDVLSALRYLQTVEKLTDILLQNP